MATCRLEMDLIRDNVVFLYTKKMVLIEVLGDRNREGRTGEAAEYVRIGIEGLR